MQARCGYFFRSHIKVALRPRSRDVVRITSGEDSIGQKQKQLRGRIVANVASRETDWAKQRAKQKGADQQRDKEEKIHVKLAERGKRTEIWCASQEPRVTVDGILKGDRALHKRPPITKLPAAYMVHESWDKYYC